MISSPPQSRRPKFLALQNSICYSNHAAMEAFSCTSKDTKSHSLVPVSKKRCSWRGPALCRIIFCVDPVVSLTDGRCSFPFDLPLQQDKEIVSSIPF